MYLSRRIVRPVLQLSEAADEVAAGQLRASSVPANAPGELGAPVGAVRRDGGAAGRGRADGAQLPDVRLARAADAADGDPRPRRGAARGRRRGSGARATSRSRRCRPRRSGSSGSSATSSTSRSSTRTASPSSPRRSTWGSSSTRRTRRSATRRAAARSTTGRRRATGPVIVSDGDRVLQIVGNLLSNAFQATPDGGRITLELAQTNGTVQRRRRRLGPGHLAREAGAALPAVRLRERRRHRARPGDRQGALDRARRPDRARLRGRARLALRARAAGRLVR